MACGKVTDRLKAGQPCAILSRMCSRYFLDADDPTRERIVSTRVNSPRNESPDLLQEHGPHAPA